MRVRQFGFFFLVVVMGCLAGVATPDIVAAQDTGLLPSASIEQETIVLESGDEADVYFPDLEEQFPVVVVLQGALVDKSRYEGFGRELARHGFVVVIPNHLQPIFGPGTPPVPFPNALGVLDVLARLEDVDPASPLFGSVDTERMGLVGHSAGGVAGLFVIEGSCIPPFCFGPPSFPRPEALRAGAFYGTNTCDASGTLSDSRCIDVTTTNPGGMLLDIETDDIPVVFVQGSRDSLATPDEAQATSEILDFDDFNGPRAVIKLKGANHYGITDVNNPPGAMPDPLDPTISQSGSVQCVAQSTGVFLRIHVKDESITQNELKCKAKG